MHLYEGFGNHICIRKDYYPVVEPIIRDLIEKNELANLYKRTEKNNKRNKKSNG